MRNQLSIPSNLALEPEPSELLWDGSHGLGEGGDESCRKLMGPCGYTLTIRSAAPAKKL